MAAKKPTTAQRMDALESALGAIAASLGVGDSTDTSGKGARSAKGASTKAKGRKVEIPSHTDRDLGYTVEPDGKYKRYTLFTYLNDDGTRHKSVRVRTDILRDALANGSDVLKFQWPEK